FAKLDADLPQPILVVQHMPAGFTEEFAHSLDRICPLEVKEAHEGDLVKPGRILIAPGDRHLSVERKPLASIAHLSDAPPENGHRPSADVLFESVAREYQNRALGIIMTGMGRDGAAKLAELYREGSRTIGQDEESSIVYGMPRVAWEFGGVMEQVSLDRMAETINRYGKEFAR
ncbi:MAG TPA: CheB methylesterase domain-containing protein, partial [Treponemataceae bacterium]|nr:CheB methylesterase domain-containing protein [Treponemataceae bacterium]